MPFCLCLASRLMDGLLSISSIVSKFMIHPMPYGGGYRVMHYFDI